MKTTFIYAGLNGLLKAEDRLRYLNLPEVRERLKQVEDIFKSQKQIEFKFEQFLRSTTEEVYAVDNISKAATAICAIQVGVSEHLMNKGITPDWTFGCSMGDLARSIVSDIVEFKTCIASYISFSDHIQGIETIGANIGISKLAGAPFTNDEIDEIRNLQLDVSVMTPKFLNIAGRYEEINQLLTEAPARGFRTVKILDYPAHSRYILPYVIAATNQVQDLKFQSPRFRVFSCISCEEITNNLETIKKELLMNTLETLRWGEAISKLEQVEEMRFINIGPCKSLTKMIPDLNLKSPIFDAATFTIDSNSQLTTTTQLHV